MSRLTGDLAAFSRVLSSALLLCGFIILGVVGGRALVTRGTPGGPNRRPSLVGRLSVPGRPGVS